VALLGAAVALVWAMTLPVLPEGERDGRAHRETERTVLEFHAEDLSGAEADAFSALVERGVADIEVLVGPSLPSWARRKGRIRFVVSRRVSISRTYGTTVLLPLERVRNRSAPYLHETAHALLPARDDRVWLSEGLASYLESWVSENRSGYDAHVFTRAGDRGIHRAAQRYLSAAAGRAVLPWVGGHGEPPEMEEDRAGVARPFYVLSQSFTKFLSDAAGLDVVVRTLVEGDPQAIGRLTPRSVEQWRREWLRTLGAPDQENTPRLRRRATHP
jgi:hypothetical protein